VCCGGPNYNTIRPHGRRIEIRKHPSGRGRFHLNRAGERIINRNDDNNSENMSSASSTVIVVCARRFCVPKKKVKTIVTTAPKNRTGHITSGTIPSAAISLARRACVITSVGKEFPARPLPHVA
jgi:hypothetical protein